jgi:predicted PurR-regulated permease PerM
VVPVTIIREIVSSIMSASVLKPSAKMRLLPDNSIRSNLFIFISVMVALLVISVMILVYQSYLAFQVDDMWDTYNDKIRKKTEYLSQIEDNFVKQDLAQIYKSYVLKKDTEKLAQVEVILKEMMNNLSNMKVFVYRGVEREQIDKIAEGINQLQNNITTSKQMMDDGVMPFRVSDFLHKNDVQLVAPIVQLKQGVMQDNYEQRVSIDAQVDRLAIVLLYFAPAVLLVFIIVAYMFVNWLRGNILIPINTMIDASKRGVTPVIKSNVLEIEELFDIIKNVPKTQNQKNYSEFNPAIFDEFPINIVVVNARSGKFIFANKHAVEDFDHVDKPFFEGMSIEEFIPAIDFDEVKKELPYIADVIVHGDHELGMALSRLNEHNLALIWKERIGDNQRIQEKSKGAKQVEQEAELEVAANLLDDEQIHAAAAGLRELFNKFVASQVEIKKHVDKVSTAGSEHSETTVALSVQMKELSESIEAVLTEFTQSSAQTKIANEKAQVTSNEVLNLAEASLKIGEVINLISDIADQINLLALNATIESARAGEAGRGFKVVANEVKRLANQTTSATEDISQQIAEIQDIIKKANEDIKEVTGAITKVNTSSEKIAEAIEGQFASANAIVGKMKQSITNNTELVGELEQINHAQLATDEQQQKLEKILAQFTG